MIDNVILLCSEVTKGMKSYGPKAFIPVDKNKKPLLIKQIDNIFETYGKKVFIYIIVGFEHDRLIKILDDFYPANLYKNIIKIFDKNYDYHNNAQGVYLGLEQINSGNCLIIQNGILTNYVPKSHNKSLLPILKNNNELFNIGLTTTDKKVEYVFYDLPTRWSEILYINKQDIYRIKDILLLNKYDLKQKFLFELINLFIDNNIVFETEYISGKNISKIINHKNKS